MNDTLVTLSTLLTLVGTIIALWRSFWTIPKDLKSQEVDLKTQEAELSAKYSKLANDAFDEAKEERESRVKIDSALKACQMDLIKIKKEVRLWKAGTVILLRQMERLNITPDWRPPDEELSTPSSTDTSD